MTISSYFDIVTLNIGVSQIKKETKRIRVLTKNTITVTKALADSLGWNYDEQKRCGVWGVVIGNTWAKTRKELHEKVVSFIQETGNSFADWSTLENAKDRWGMPIFSIETI